MKYAAPQYEKAVIKATDIIAASSDSYEIEQNDNGNGNIIMKAANLFK